MLDHRLRRWPSIMPALGHRLVFAELNLFVLPTDFAYHPLWQKKRLILGHRQFSTSIEPASGQYVI